MEDYFLDFSCRNRRFSGPMLICINLGNGSHHVESFWQRTASKKCVQSSLSCVHTSMLPIVQLHHQEIKITATSSVPVQPKPHHDFRVSHCQVNTLSTSTIGQTSDSQFSPPAIFPTDAKLNLNDCRSCLHKLRG